MAGSAENASTQCLERVTLGGKVCVEEKKTSEDQEAQLSRLYLRHM